MIWVAVATKVVVRGDHVGLYAPDDAHQVFGRVVKVGGAVVVIAPWILVPCIADHARVAEAEVLEMRHTKGGHRRSDFAHAGFAKAFVRFGGVPLWDDDLAELAAGTGNHIGIGGGAVGGGVGGKGSTHADRLVVGVGVYRHENQSTAAIHALIVRAQGGVGRLP